MGVTGTDLPQPQLLTHEQGERHRFLSALHTIKLGGAQTRHRLSVLEVTAPAGFRPPRHRHDIEDELVYVLDGEVTFWCAGRTAACGPGGLAWLPRGLPHRLEVSDDGPARFLQLTTPAQYDDLVRTVGQAASVGESPGPEEHHLDELAQGFADFQIEILPPG